MIINKTLVEKIKSTLIAAGYAEGQQNQAGFYVQFFEEEQLCFIGYGYHFGPDANNEDLDELAGIAPDDTLFPNPDGLYQYESFRNVWFDMHNEVLRGYRAVLQLANIPTFLTPFDSHPSLTVGEDKVTPRSPEFKDSVIEALSQVPLIEIHSAAWEGSEDFCQVAIYKDRRILILTDHIDGREDVELCQPNKNPLLLRELVPFLSQFSLDERSIDAGYLSIAPKS